MSFLPQAFLSNVRGKDGLARPCRFQVILPIPTYVNQFVENGLFDRLLNLPNAIFANVTARIAG